MVTGAPDAATIRGLTVDLPDRRLVDGVDLTLPSGRIVALVGPSGSGKTLTARALLPHAGRVSRAGRAPDAGPVTYGGEAVVAGRVGYIFQDALSSLNPTMTVGRHLTETGASRQDGAAALRDTGLGPELLDAHPFELSGGQARRVALALATVGRPSLVIADEITTALDPGTRRGILDLLRTQALERSRAVLLITHDLAAAEGWADEVAVMSEGRIVDYGATGTVLAGPGHPMTRRLLDASRPNPPARVASPGRAMLRTEAVSKVLRGRSRSTTAVREVDLTVRENESVAVLGPSGAGKSTLLGLLGLLDRPDSGRVLLHDRDVWRLPARRRRAERRRIGTVFQQALASFDPRFTVERVVAQAAADRATVRELLERVGLAPEVAGRRPVTLSGGERQRVAIARALAAVDRTRDGAVLLADEPTSGLDVLARHQVLELLDDLRENAGFGFVFVTHDHVVAEHLADRVLGLESGVLGDAAGRGADTSRSRASAGS